MHSGQVFPTGVGNDGEKVKQRAPGNEPGGLQKENMRPVVRFLFITRFMLDHVFQYKRPHRENIGNTFYEACLYNAL